MGHLRLKYPFNTQSYLPAPQSLTWGTDTGTYYFVCLCSHLHRYTCMTYKAMNGGPATDSDKADVCYIFVYEESQEGEAVCGTPGADSTYVLCTVHGGN